MIRLIGTTLQNTYRMYSIAFMFIQFADVHNKYFVYLHNIRSIITQQRNSRTFTFSGQVSWSVNTLWKQCALKANQIILFGLTLNVHQSRFDLDVFSANKIHKNLIPMKWTSILYSTICYWQHNKTLTYLITCHPSYQWIMDTHLCTF